MNMGVFPSGQWGQTVNLLLSASVVRIHPRPPKNLNVHKYAEVFVLLQSQTHWAGGFEQQRSRPPPAAVTGRRGWGSAPLFQNPAKGLQKKRQAQLVRPAEWSGGQKSPCGAFLDARFATSTRAHQKTSTYHVAFPFSCFISPSRPPCLAG